MDADCFGDFGHVHGAEVAGAIFEEGSLAGDDFASDGEDCFLALVDGVDHGAAFAELVAEVEVGFLVVGGIGEEFFVFAVDADFGKVAAGEGGGPLVVFVAVDFDIGEDVGIAAGEEARAG